VAISHLGGGGDIGVETCKRNGVFGPGGGELICCNRPGMLHRGDRFRKIRFFSNIYDAKGGPFLVIAHRGRRNFEWISSVNLFFKFKKAKEGLVVRFFRPIEDFSPYVMLGTWPRAVSTGWNDGKREENKGGKHPVNIGLLLEGPGYYTGLFSAFSKNKKE